MLETTLFTDCQILVVVDMILWVASRMEDDCMTVYNSG